MVNGNMYSLHNGKCLDYHTGTNNVYMHDCHDGSNQKWYFDEDTKAIRSEYDHRCLDVHLAVGQSDNVYMHECHEGANQQFEAWLHVVGVLFGRLLRCLLVLCFVTGFSGQANPFAPPIWGSSPAMRNCVALRLKGTYIGSPACRIDTKQPAKPSSSPYTCHAAAVLRKRSRWSRSESCMQSEHRISSPRVPSSSCSISSKGNQRRRICGFPELLGPPVVPFYPLLGEGSPTKIDYRKRVPLF